MTKKESPTRLLCRALAWLAVACVLAAALFGAPPVSAAGRDGVVQHTLRVGYYAYTGYNIMDADGNRSGYAYDVLQQFARYENVKFEYLGYDCDSIEAMDMLERGEVDILPMLRQTPERAERFDFSTDPIGNVATMLTIKAGNRSIVAGNYATFDGMIVGMSRTGNGRNESFAAYAEEHGFSYTPVYFDTDEELSAALCNGTITAAVSNRMRRTTNEWIIDIFGLEDIYIAVRKGDNATLRLVNDAMTKMDLDDPSWRTILYDKYYSGSPTGIMVDLFKRVADRARLNYRFLTPADSAEYTALLHEGTADFVIDLNDDYSAAEDYGYKLTDPYLTTEFSWVMLRNHDGALSKVAVANNFNPDKLKMPGLADDAAVQTLDSFGDCLAALRSGQIDAYYTYTYQAEGTVFNDEHSDLRSMLSDERCSFCIGVGRDYDVLLCGILNKSVNSLTRAEVVSITNKYVNLGRQKFSLVRLAYQYPPILVLAVLCLVITVVCMMLVLRSRRFRAQTEAALYKAEEASAAKTEFLSNMSHDIRTPINGIMGMLDIAEDNFDDPARVRDCMRKMRGASSHLLSLVNDVLDMSKIESGSMQLLNAPFDLRVLLDSCCSIIEGQIAERSMTFTKQIGPFWHPYLVGSELHIRQVLINILSNAVKYTPDGGEINFRAKETLFEEGFVHLRMEIKDNGIGMSEEFLQHIFEPFTQEQRTSRTTYKGTGLGMAITKKLVDQMHGSLDVESEPGKGSTFLVRLSLPVGTMPESAPVPAPQPAAGPAAPAVEAAGRAPAVPRPEKPADKPLAGLHLLLAEDNELNSEIAVTLLENAGAEITAVENGRLAVEAMQNAAPHTYDAVLMDVMMPEMNGLEAARCIRAFEGKDAGEGTPIIAMTANVFADDVKSCLDAGMNSHVGKPLDMRLLISEIVKYTRR